MITRTPGTYRVPTLHYQRLLMGPSRLNDERAWVCISRLSPPLLSTIFA